MTTLAPLVIPAGLGGLPTKRNLELGLSVGRSGRGLLWAACPISNHNRLMLWR